MRKLLPLLFTLILFLAACSPATTSSVLSQVTPPAQPDQNTAAAVGRVLNKANGEPLGDVIVRLAEVYRDGAEEGVFVLNHTTSPGTRTDAQGYFTFENLTPGEYVMAIGEGENINDYDIIEDDSTRQAKIWQATAGEIADWGVSRAEVLFR